MPVKQNYNVKILLILLHIIVWGCFLFYPYFFYTITYSSKVIMKHHLMIRHLMATFLLIIYFYLNTFFLIPQLLVKKKIAYYVIVNILIMVIIVLCNVGLHNFLLEGHYNTYHWLKYRMMSSAFFSSMLIWGLSSGIKITGEWLKNERLKKEMENEKLISELSSLKAQVNPHFLFNSLNSIYALANKKSDATADAIVKLSDMMRYMLYEVPDDTVNLSKEIKYLNDYIELQKLRVNEKVKISFITEGDFSREKIEPMLLVPFVENAFKHGISYQNNTFITIRLKIQNKQFEFYIENSLHPITGNKDKTSGIGLKNVKRRLDLLYENKYDLVITETNNTFVVHLKLNLSYA